MSDTPIEEKPFVGGVTVIDIGDVRVSRGLSRRAFSGCNHFRLVYDRQERRIWCKDCETNIEGFDAFELLANQMHTATEKLRKREERLNEIEQFQIRSLAAKNMDDAWRRRKMVPACPHCSQGLFPEDFKTLSMIGRDYAEARLRKLKGGQ